jgi:UDP-N-acetylmuramoyl-L-alanyl-D-glutamate--2,6-diaminopimelate ligase
MAVRIFGPSGCAGSLDSAVMIGRHNAANLVCAFSALCELGIESSEIIRALKGAEAPPGRLQRVDIHEGDFPFAVFVDYAHTHDALENVLTALRTTMQSKTAEARIRNGRLICVFGCGGDRDRTKRPKMGAVAERLADVVIVTSDNPRTEEPNAIIAEICAGFSAEWKQAAKITIEPNRRAAIKLAIGMAKPGDVVLLAGKGHENYQIIGTTKHHFDDVEEAENALRDKLSKHEDAKTQRKIP